MRCLSCKKELSGYQKKFCSRSCSATFNNSKRPKRKKKTRFCLNCGDDFYCREKRDNKYYCSQECRIEYRRKEYISDWTSGKIDGTTGSGKYRRVSQRIRIYLFEKEKYKCPRCSWSEMNPTTGKIPLEVDHIDGDWTNNRPENLRVLCPNCHSLTPTYKGANRGNSPSERCKGKRAGG